MREYRILPEADIQAQREYIQKIRAHNEHIANECGSPRFAYVQTFGCQQNEADSEKLAGMCELMGYESVELRLIYLSETPVPCASMPSKRHFP